MKIIIKISAVMKMKIVVKIDNKNQNKEVISHQPRFSASRRLSGVNMLSPSSRLEHSPSA